MLWNSVGPRNERGFVSLDQFNEWRSRSAALEGMGALKLWTNDYGSQADWVQPSSSERVRAGFVTTNLFDLLGVHAARGRLFSSDDEEASGDIAVVSEAFWKRRMSADTAVIGRKLHLQIGRGRTRQSHLLSIVGVLPGSFRFTYPLETEVWVPLTRDSLSAEPGLALTLHVIGRLIDGLSLRQAQVDIDAVAASTIEVLPQFESAHVSVQALHEWVVGNADSVVLLGVCVATLVLLIACVTVATLLLARMSERRSEIVVRHALGASRMRLIRQFVVEGVALGLIGGCLGLVAAQAFLPFLVWALPDGVPRVDEIRIDPATLLFAAVVSTAAGLGASLIPAIKASAASDTRSIEAALPAAASWRRGLVALQVAVTVPLLTAAGLFLQSMWNSQHVKLGFDPSDTVAMDIRLLSTNYLRSPIEATRFADVLLARLRGLQGVAQVASTSSVPLQGVFDQTWMLNKEGGGPRGGPLQAVRVRDIDPDYFSLLRVSLRAGRTFSGQDVDGSKPVAILSESLARKWFGNDSPLGVHMRLRQQTEIIGVVADVRHERLDGSPEPALYLPRSQSHSTVFSVLVRTSSPAAVVGGMRAAVHAVDPRQPVDNIYLLESIVGNATATQRSLAYTVLAFAVMAYTLVLGGIFGIVSTTVAERTREIGIRCALGAQSSQLTGLIMRQTMSPVLLGASLGAIGAWWSSTLLQRFLFGVNALEVTSHFISCLLIVTFTIPACYLPARRATKITPLDALRQG